MKHGEYLGQGPEIVSRSLRCLPALLLPRRYLGTYLLVTKVGMDAG